MRIPCRCSYVNLSDAGDPDDQRESRERNSMLVAGNCSKDDAEGGCVCVVDSILAAQEAEPRATERERDLMTTQPSPTAELGIWIVVGPIH